MISYSYKCNTVMQSSSEPSYVLDLYKPVEIRDMNGKIVNLDAFDLPPEGSEYNFLNASEVNRKTEVNFRNILTHKILKAMREGEFTVSFHLKDLAMYDEMIQKGFTVVKYDSGSKMHISWK